MNEWEEEAWNTTAPPRYDFDRPEEPIREIPSFEVNTRPGYRPAPPQQQQPIMGGPYSRLIGSNWQNPSFGPAKGAQEYTQGIANTGTGVAMFGKGLVTDTGETLKAAGEAMVDPQTYAHMFRSAIGLEGGEGLGEFWSGMAIPAKAPRRSRVQQGALWNIVKDKPGTKRVRELLDGVGREIVEEHPDHGAWFREARKAKDHKKIVDEHMARSAEAGTRKPQNDPLDIRFDIQGDMWKALGDNPYNFARREVLRSFDADRYAGMYDPATRRVFIPRPKNSHNRHTIRHEDAHALFDKRHSPRVTKTLPQSGKWDMTPGGLAEYPLYVKDPKATWKGFSYRFGQGMNYVDEATANIVGEKSVTKGLRKWGNSLLRPGTIYEAHLGRPAGILTLGLAETMDAGRRAWNAGVAPRVVRTGILMNDNSSQEGLPAENTKVDRTRFYSP